MNISLDGSGQRATGCLFRSAGITVSGTVQDKSGRIGHCLLIDMSLLMSPLMCVYHMNVNSDGITKELAAARGQDESASLGGCLLS